MNAAFDKLSEIVCLAIADVNQALFSAPLRSLTNCMKMTVLSIVMGSFQSLDQVRVLSEAGIYHTRLTGIWRLNTKISKCTEILQRLITLYS